MMIRKKNGGRREIANRGHAQVALNHKLNKNSLFTFGSFLNKALKMESLKNSQKEIHLQ